MNTGFIINRKGSHRIITTALVTALAAPMSLAIAGGASAATVSDSTATILTHMVAEEKLAHDVYTVLGETFDVNTFENIAASEARHQASIQKLLAAYGVTDPTVGDAVGKFDDPELQALYNQLIASGSTSIQAAAQAGISIEKLDISDLQKAIATNPAADITRVLNNLLRGSQNHLKAFTALHADPTATTSGQEAGHSKGQSQGKGNGMGAGKGASKGAGVGNGSGQGRR